ncbi:MAG: pseudouridine synthase [Mariprofundaceae bacterium]|nr:pseudouridine synthase [Mariprofundaceae bacterium]
MRYLYQPPPAQALHILFQDETILMVDKPSGLLSVPGRGEDRQDCMSSRVQDVFPEALVVHRLDMSTSGIMVFALNQAMQRDLNALFANREVHKTYTAVVHGLLVEDKGEINQPLMTDWENRPRQKIDTEHGKASKTLYQVVSRDVEKQTCVLCLTPITGRSHQLRLHMAWLEHPILGDKFYAPRAVQQQADRLLLHATSIRFQHPISQEMLDIHCALGW